jgi:molybdopterin converting factor subunit 1
MIITVIPFASVKDTVGYSRKEFSLGDGTSVREVLENMISGNESLARLRGSLLFAVNREYVETGHILHDGDQLAIFPPVSGG